MKAVRLRCKKKYSNLFEKDKIYDGYYEDESFISIFIYYNINGAFGEKGYRFWVFDSSFGRKSIDEYFIDIIKDRKIKLKKLNENSNC